MNFFLVVFWMGAVSLSAAELEGVTRPSADVSASFTRSGLIASVQVREGALVQKGQLLAELESEAEKKQMLLLRRQADSTLEEDKAQIEIDFRQKELKGLQEAMEKGATTQKEINDAELALKTARMNLRQAKFDRELAELKYQELESQNKMTRLRSPVEGLVEALSIDAGEPSHVNEEHVRIVRINPLWVEVAVPLAEARGLKSGSLAQVLFDGGRISSREGKVIFVSPVADTASDTVRVKIEVLNEEQRMAGERVKVLFATKENK
jgi:RND family efflux transporter MFP subunit